MSYALLSRSSTHKLGLVLTILVNIFSWTVWSVSHGRSSNLDSSSALQAMQGHAAKERTKGQFLFKVKGLTFQVSNSHHFNFVQICCLYRRSHRVLRYTYWTMKLLYFISIRGISFLLFRISKLSKPVLQETSRYVTSLCHSNDLFRVTEIWEN